MISPIGSGTLPRIEADSGSSEPQIESHVLVHRSLIVRTLALLAILFLIADLVVQTIDFEWQPDSFIWPHIVRFVDLNREVSLPTWFSVSMLSTAAILAGIIAAASWKAEERYRLQWVLLALLFAGFSIDEGAQIHDSTGGEPLRDVLGTSGLLYYAWVIPAFISAIIATLIFARFVLALPSRTRLLFILSAATFAFGAIGFEMISGWYTDTYPGATLGYATLTSLEEFLEMCGVILLLAGLLDYASQRLGQTRIIWEEDTEPEPQLVDLTVIAGKARDAR